MASVFEIRFNSPLIRIIEHDAYNSITETVYLLDDPNFSFLCWENDPNSRTGNRSVVILNEDDKLLPKIFAQCSHVVSYNSIGTPDSLLKSLSVRHTGLEKYEFLDEETQNLISCDKKRWVDVLFPKREQCNLRAYRHKQIARDIEADKCFERLSKTLKVSIPATEKYEGCDVEAENFFSSYYYKTSISRE